MSKQRKKGTWFETKAVEYGNVMRGGNDLFRRALAGSNDMGDIAGFTVMGKRCVVECKNAARYEIPKWLEEAERERGNADAEYGVVLFHQKGVGERNFGKNPVVMTYDTFLAMSAGGFALLEGGGDD